MDDLGVPRVFGKTRLFYCHGLTNVIEFIIVQYCLTENNMIQM